MASLCYEGEVGSISVRLSKNSLGDLRLGYVSTDLPMSGEAG